MKHNILVVEDEKSLQKQIKSLLTINGYTIKIASDAAAVAEHLKKFHPDLIILDLNYPTNNETLCQEIRNSFPDLPVIILTAKKEITDASPETEFRADDYIIKPFLNDELLTRVKIRLHKHDMLETYLQIADLELNATTLEVKRNGKTIQLTPQEFKLLHYLMSNKGRILTREMILSRIWMYSSDIETRVVDVYVGYLRKKIDAEFEKKLLHSVRGFGYVIKE